MFSLPVLVALAVVAVVTSFISGIFGMAGGMLLIGFLLMFLPVPVAMVFHGVIQIAANGWRTWLWRHHVRWSVVLQFGSGAAPTRREGAPGRRTSPRLRTTLARLRRAGQ